MGKPGTPDSGIQGAFEYGRFLGKNREICAFWAANSCKHWPDHQIVPRGTILHDLAVSRVTQLSGRA
jgi:hypothetical protein